jgi:hypothetical protein
MRDKRSSGSRWSFGRNQAGEGKAALIVGILVVVAAGYFVKLTLPPRIDKAELKEYVEERTRAYVTMQINMDQLVSSIQTEAQKMGLPVTEESIEILDSETRVVVKIKYDLVQRLIGGKEWVQHYDIESEVPRV